MLWILHLWSDAAFRKVGDKHQGSNEKCKSKHKAEIDRLSARSPVKAVEVTASQSTHGHDPKNRIRSKNYHSFLRFQQNDNDIRYTLVYFFSHGKRFYWMIAQENPDSWLFARIWWILGFPLTYLKPQGVDKLLIPFCLSENLVTCSAWLQPCKLVIMTLSISFNWQSNCIYIIATDCN